MKLREPESTEECFYFTNRQLGETGEAMAWVYKPMCPKCKKAKLGKPVDEKTGKVKIRAKEYVCPACKSVFDKAKLDPTLTVEIKYTCPGCGNEGETTTEYKRKSFQRAPSYVFTCQKCNVKLGLTKKLKGV